jgi:hypothetical protein
MTWTHLSRICFHLQLKPRILKLLSWQQVQELFTIYFDNMHKLLPVLHPGLHTPISVLARSEFLFTTYVSSIYYRAKAESSLRAVQNMCHRVPAARRIGEPAQ